jgi:hypothetical protein
MRSVSTRLQARAEAMARGRSRNRFPALNKPRGEAIRTTTRTTKGNQSEAYELIMAFAPSAQRPSKRPPNIAAIGFSVPPPIIIAMKPNVPNVSPR